MNLKTRIVIGAVALELLVAGCAPRASTPLPSPVRSLESQLESIRPIDEQTLVYLPPYVAAEHSREYETIVLKVHNALKSNGYVLTFKGDGYEVYRFTFELTYSDGHKRYFQEFNNIGNSLMPGAVTRGEVLSYSWVNGKGMDDLSAIVSVKGLTGNAAITTKNTTAVKIVSAEAEETRKKLEIEFPVGKFISDLQSAAPYGAGKAFIAVEEAGK